MKHTLTLLTALLLAPLTETHADDTAKIAAFISRSSEQGGVVLIPPGDYELDGKAPLTLTSGMTVSACGARFHFPKMPRSRRKGCDVHRPPIPSRGCDV